MATRIWTPNPDGEYNEQATILDGRKLTIASDRSERRWFYMVDDGEMVDLEAGNEYDARAEALRSAAS